MVSMIQEGARFMLILCGSLLWIMGMIETRWYFGVPLIAACLILWFIGVYSIDG